MDGRLDGRIAVVTGAGSGIGRASARRLSAEGARVVAVDVDYERVRDCAEEVGGTFVNCDVSSEEQVSALYDDIYATHGHIDIAFHNAGISPPGDGAIADSSLSSWENVQLVNLTSVYLCCRHVIPYMVRQKRGAIINMASFVALMGSAASQISYTASKGGVLAMTRELGVQFARDGVRVNALCPGPVATPLLKTLFAQDPQDAASRRLVHIPMGRFAEPEEIASAVAFLASDDASFITAATFVVDGGITAAYVTPM